MVIFFVGLLLEVLLCSDGNNSFSSKNWRLTTNSVLFNIIWFQCWTWNPTSLWNCYGTFFFEAFKKWIIWMAEEKTTEYPKVRFQIKFKGEISAFSTLFLKPYLLRWVYDVHVWPFYENSLILHTVEFLIIVVP